jgi:glutaredoxin-like YruB-family protein
MLKRTVLAFIILLLTVSLAGAEMYQWIDNKGVVTFKDTPPPPSKKNKKVKTYSDGDFDPAPPYQPAAKTRAVKSAVATAPAAPSAQIKVRFTGTVELYVTDWCGYCKKAKKYLTDKGVPFVAYDIEKDGAARERHKALGGNGVPLIIIGANKMSGFSPETLEYYLENGK